MDGGFRLTYSTMFDPPPELHRRFEAALEATRARLGRDLPMWIDGKEHGAASAFEVRSPIDTSLLLARFPAGGAAEAARAVAAARAAFPAWARTPWQERVKRLRRAAALIEERVYEIGAAVALEVGKNRMESLGEVQETADLIAWYCDRMEAEGGFVRELPDDPLPGFASRNRTVLKPWGAWVVIAPFNFPFALAGGPVGAALVAGNTVVFKTASVTAWSGWLLLECLRDAGLPDGVVNYVTGAGGEAGAALVGAEGVGGITFTGSYEVGMGIVRAVAAGPWPRPCIAEMGGKNAAIVSRKGNIADAALGVMRSAFGLSGQKCSACSRVYVEQTVFGDFVLALHAATAKIAVGDPTQRANWMGPVIDAAAVARFEDAVAQVQSLDDRGAIIHGGERLDQGDLALGRNEGPHRLKAVAFLITELPALPHR